MHNNHSFREAFKKSPDLTLNEYRNSPEGRRLNEATGGEALRKTTVCMFVMQMALVLMNAPFKD